jgi:hypothetical protein
MLEESMFTKKVVELMGKLNSPWVRGSIFMILFMGCLSFLSYMTDEKTAGAVAKGMIEFQFKDSVRDVMREEIEPIKSDLNSLKNDIQAIKESVARSDARFYLDVIMQIENMHEKIQKGDAADITDSKLKMYIDYWKDLPDQYKTVSLTAKFEILNKLYLKRVYAE